MKDNRIRRVMDESLSNMEFGGGQRQAVFAKIEGEPVMKKKLSTGLIFALVMMLAVTTALAVVYWRDSAKEIAVMEAAKGYFDTWEADDRVKLVGLLVDSGEMEADDATQRLLLGTLDDKASRQLATDILTDWTGLPEDAVTLMSILEKVWGRYPYQWTPENLVWYTDTLAETGRLGSDHDVFLLPPEDGISKEEAISIAQAATEEAFGVAPGTMDGYIKGAAYRLPEAFRDHAPVWEVSFTAPVGELRRLFSGELWVSVDASGQIVDEPESWMLTPADSVQRIREAEMSDDEADYKRFWTHEERAAHDSRSYAVPDDKAVSEAEAIRIATEKVREKWGYSDADIAHLTPYAIYWAAGNRSTESVWEISFYDEATRLPDRFSILQVFMQATTGEVISTNPYN